MVGVVHVEDYECDEDADEDYEDVHKKLLWDEVGIDFATLVDIDLVGKI